MDTISIWMTLGFLMAAYSVIANDSVQTLGTWIASNNERFNWKVLWVAASSVLLWAIWYAWFTHSGDISYGRLARIPYVEPQWYHVLAPLVLVVLTRIGLPVSTSFIVLSAFASSFVLEAMLIKSVIGYVLAGISAYLIWWLITKYFDESAPVKEEHKGAWRLSQWIVTGFLWWTWLSHDMANIAVFLPRQIPLELMFVISIVFVSGLGWMFRERGGRIQKIVLNKHNTRYVRSATIIDLVYLIILFIFKEVNNIPMSTTWVFVGLLSGRELAHATFNERVKFDGVFPLVAADFFKLIVGVAASVSVVLLIHMVILPS